jgi:hypothetical protein
MYWKKVSLKNEASGNRHSCMSLLFSTIFIVPWIFYMIEVLLIETWSPKTCFAFKSLTLVRSNFVILISVHYWATGDVQKNPWGGRPSYRHRLEVWSTWHHVIIQFWRIFKEVLPCCHELHVTHHISISYTWSRIIEETIYLNFGTILLWVILSLCLETSNRLHFSSGTPYVHTTSYKWHKCASYVDGPKG